MRYFSFSNLSVAALTLAILTLAFSSCETEVDIYDDYDIVPVVYGLLDPSDNGVDPLLDRKDGWHWIRFTRSFQSKENPFDGAASPDSSAFDRVEAKVLALNNRNEVVKTYELIDSTLAKSNDGDFAGGTHTVYGFKENSLDATLKYRLEATCFLDGEQYPISAETELINGTSSSVFASTNFSPIIAGSFIAGNQFKSSIVYEITPAKNTRYGDLVLNFYYKDFYSGADSTLYDTSRVVTINLGGFTVSNLSDPNSKELYFSGERFFQRLGTDIPDFEDMPSNFLYRKIDLRGNLGEIEFVSGAAGEDLYTYIEVNQPQNEGFQARPVFTNIEGGVGIFSSRAIFSIPYFSIDGQPLQILSLSTNTKIEIGKAQFLVKDNFYTGNKAFCFDESAVNDGC